MTNTNNPLPETVKTPEYVVDIGEEFQQYHKVSVAHELEVARVAGCVPSLLCYRVYGERVMWRLTFSITKQMTNDEAKRIAWGVLVRCFGAYKPEFFKSDDQDTSKFVGVWFTNGAKNVHRAINF